MEKILLFAALLLGILFLSSRCDRTASTVHNPPTDPPPPIDIQVYSQTAEQAIAEVRIEHRWGGAHPHLFLTNAVGYVAPIGRMGTDTLMFSKTGWEAASLVVHDTTPLHQARVYLDSVATPRNADQVTGKVFLGTTAVNKMMIVNLDAANRDSCRSDATGSFRLPITSTNPVYNIGFVLGEKDTTKVKLNAGPGNAGKLDVFFDDSKLNALRRRQN